jgi:NTE family protein
VLSGGGSYGAAQAGMLKAVVESGFVPDHIVGVSAGALNGAAIAQDFSLSSAENLCQAWSNASHRSIFPSRGITQLLHVVTIQQSLQPSHGVRRLLESFGPVADLADLSESVIPLHVGAVDLASGYLRWFSTGPCMDVLTASCALPGVFPPVDVEGVTYIDGGVVSNVPWLKALSFDPAQIVCLDVSLDSSSSAAPESALGVLIRAFGHSRIALKEMEQALVPEGIPVWHITCDLSHVGSGSFSKSAQLTKEGYEAASTYLAERPYQALEMVAQKEHADKVSVVRKLSQWRKHYGIR